MKRYVLRFNETRFFGTSAIHTNYYRFKFQALKELEYFKKNDLYYNFKLFKIIKLKPIKLKEII